MISFLRLNPNSLIGSSPASPPPALAHLTAAAPRSGDVMGIVQSVIKGAPATSEAFVNGVVNRLPPLAQMGRDEMGVIINSANPGNGLNRSAIIERLLTINHGQFARPTVEAVVRNMPNNVSASFEQTAIVDGLRENLSNIGLRENEITQILRSSGLHESWLTDLSRPALTPHAAAHLAPSGAIQDGGLAAPAAPNAPTTSVGALRPAAVPELQGGARSSSVPGSPSPSTAGIQDGVTHAASTPVSDLPAAGQYAIVDNQLVKVGADAATPAAPTASERNLRHGGEPPPNPPNTGGSPAQAPVAEAVLAQRATYQAANGTLYERQADGRVVRTPDVHPSDPRYFEPYRPGEALPGQRLPDGSVQGPRMPPRPTPTSAPTSAPSPATSTGARVATVTTAAVAPTETAGAAAVRNLETLGTRVTVAVVRGATTVARTVAAPVARMIGPENLTRAGSALRQAVTNRAESRAGVAVVGVLRALVGNSATRVVGTLVGGALRTVNVAGTAYTLTRIADHTLAAPVNVAEHVSHALGAQAPAEYMDLRGGLNGAAATLLGTVREDARHLGINLPSVPLTAAAANVNLVRVVRSGGPEYRTVSDRAADMVHSVAGSLPQGAIDVIDSNRVTRWLFS